MGDLQFQKTQYQFASHLRNPDENPAPAGIEDRRLTIYRDLIFNNIKGFIDSGFPVLCSITPESTWNNTIRSFIAQYSAKSPYFSEVSKEFLNYLSEDECELNATFEFACELAHYEWVELALMIDPKDITSIPVKPSIDLLNEKLLFSPLAWPMVYEYDVHHIGADYIPEAKPEQPTFIVIYRDRSDDVNFMQINALTYQLIDIAQNSPHLTGAKMLDALQKCVPQMPAESIFKHGLDILLQLFKRDIILSATD
ncbi:MAG: putative DNA-binding domain-containing protein [Gammaproteobacteria bacterium]|nr:putative DNA-binding domain-containing protein [Gammaproteobacteria bacterium]